MEAVLNTHPPGLELSCALGDLRSCWRVGYGMMQQIAFAFEFGQNDRLFGPKARLVSLAVAAHMDAHNGYGHGNKAAKREACLSTMSDRRLALSMQERDRRVHADLCFDREFESRIYPQRLNPHP